MEIKKYNKYIKENSDNLLLVNSFIEHLFHNNDIFYNIGDGNYVYDKSKNTITFNLKPYGGMIKKFIDSLKLDLLNFKDLKLEELSDDKLTIKIVNKLNENLNKSEYKNVLDYLNEVLDKHSEKNGIDKSDFIKKYLSDPENNQILGLIESSDIWEFYLSYRNECDSILLENKFYSQSRENITGLYDYVIEGTKKSIFYFIKSMVD
jgi:hypothetical protein